MFMRLQCPRVLEGRYNLHRKIFGTIQLLPTVERGHHVDVVRHLNEAEGVDVQSKDVYRKTPVLHAAKEGHEAVVCLLLEKGAEVR
jgi:hypothetical protein